jgi:hypothetical protein
MKVNCQTEMKAMKVIMLMRMNVCCYLRVEMVMAMKSVPTKFHYFLWKDMDYGGLQEVFAGT